MFWKVKLRKEVRFLVGSLVLIALLGISANHYDSQICHKLHILIDDSGGNRFLEERDIQTLLDSSGREFLLNTPYKLLNTKKLEQRVKANPFVENCRISKKLNGELLVMVKMVKPIVRVMAENESYYLDKEGKRIPLSKKYSPYCLVLSGDNVYFDTKNKLEDKKLLDLLNFIVNTDIWRSHIIEIHKRKNTIQLYLQLSDVVVDFGSWADWEEKMKKMEILCKYILPKKGWNRYEKVSLKYHQQIVCEYAKR
jgi:cell division protein FtsQ